MASLLEAQQPTGDERSFDLLYRTYKGDVQRLAGRLLRNSADGEDATQTVFLNVLRALRQGVRPAEPRAWLFAITRNVCTSRQRAVACRPNEVELDPERLVAATNGDGPTTDEIVGAIARMLPGQRTALILRDFRGAAPGEIGDLLGLTDAGVEALLTRARASFRKELEAGDQPFDCTVTRDLVRRQLAGEISAGDRHSLKAHLRDCTPCSTTARSLRSSLGKLASIVWPGGIVERLGTLFTQMPTAHVAGAVTSTALVTSIAVPVALTPPKAVVHVPPASASAAPAADASAPNARRAASQADGASTHKAIASLASAKAAAALSARKSHRAVARPGAAAKVGRPGGVHRSAAPTEAGATTTAATAGQSSPTESVTRSGSPQTEPTTPHGQTSAESQDGTAAAPPRARGQRTGAIRPIGGTPVRKSARPNRTRRHGLAPPGRLGVDDDPAEPGASTSPSTGQGPAEDDAPAVQSSTPAASSGSNSPNDRSAASTAPPPAQATPPKSTAPAAASSNGDDTPPGHKKKR